VNHADWHARGFSTLPVIPPGAEIAGFFKGAVQVGKVPGRQLGSGKWYPYKWDAQPAPSPTAADLWGAGVGLACDQGLRAVDIDCRDETLSAALAAATMGVAPGGALRIGRAPKQLLLYRATGPMRKAKLRFTRPGLAEGAKPECVEILADGQFFVADGTHPDTLQPYRWPNGRPALADLPLLGDAQAAALLEAWRAAIEGFGGHVLGGGGSGGGDGGSAEALLAPGDDEAAREAAVEAALAAAPMARDRDDWIAVGIAVKAAGGTLEQWQTWSEKWGPEDPADLARRWEGFREPYRVGWKLLEVRAREGGWQGGADLDFAAFGTPAGTGAGVEAGAGAEGGTIQERMFREYRWIEAVQRFGCLTDRAVLSALQFSARLPQIGPPMSQTKRAAAVFLADERRIALAGLTYHPGGDSEVEEPGLGRCFNTWRPSGLVPVAGDVGWWLRHVEALFPVREERETLLDWMAAVAQRQAEKPNFAPVVGGAPGIGKDLMLQPLVRLLGQHNVAVIGMADLVAPQNDFCASARLVIVNEAHSFERVSMAEKLKPHISAPPDVIWINTKNVPQYALRNRHAMVFFTNRRDAVAIEAGDRRYFVLWSELKRGWQPEGYFIGMWSRLNSGGAEHVAAWLLARDVSRFNMKGEAPDTAAKAAMAEATLTEAAEFVRDGWEGWPDLVNPGDLLARAGAMDARRRHNGLSARRLAIELREGGAITVNGGAMVRLPSPCATGTDRVRLFALRNHEKYSGMPPVALAREFLRQWAENTGNEFRPYAPALTVVPKNPGEDLL